MAEKVEAFFVAYGSQERANSAPEFRNGSIEAADEANRNGVCTGDEYDGYRCGCRLGCESRHLSADGNNDSHLPTHERGRKRRQPVVLTVRPAVVDHDVLALDKTSFVQSLAKDGDKIRIGSGRTAAEESNHRQPTLLRMRGERPRRRRTAEQ